MAKEEIGLVKFPVPSTGVNICSTSQRGIPNASLIFSLAVASTFALLLGSELVKAAIDSASHSILAVVAYSDIFAAEAFFQRLECMLCACHLCFSSS